MTGRRHRFALAAAIAGLLVVPPLTARADSFQFTIAASHPPVSAWVKVLQEYVVQQSISEAEKLGHEITWTEAYAGVLFKFDTAVQALADGIAEFAWIGTLWQQNQMPLTNVTFYAPFGTGDPLVLNDIQNQLHDTQTALTNEWEDNGIVYLGGQSIDGYVILSTEPVNTLDDLKGMKLMAPGAVSLWAAGAGAVGVDGGLPEYYNHIKTGVADGALIPGSAILPFKLQEVAKHVTHVNLGGCICGAFAVNKDTWDSLPEDMRAMFREIGREYGRRVAQLIADSRSAHFDILETQGVTFTELSAENQRAWADAMPDIAGEWIAGLDSHGAGARDVLIAYMAAQRAKGVTPLRDWDDAR